MKKDQHKLLQNIDSFAMRYFLFGILIMTVGCREDIVTQPRLFLCDKYSLEQYSDSLFADTLTWKDDTSTINWYKHEIDKIITEIKINCKDSTSTVFPFHDFNEVTYYNNTMGLLGKKLNEAETKRLIKLINNPLNFEWGETTFEANSMIIFEMRGKEIARLEIMNNWIIKSQPNNLLMKFGALDKEGIKQLNKLIDDI